MKPNEENIKPSNILNQDESGLRQRKDQNNNERIKNLVAEMRAKQIEHELNQKNREKFNRYKPFIIGGGMFLVGILFIKFYRSILE